MELITLFISVSVLIFWIPLLNKNLGIGTIFNALIIALMIDICIKFFPCSRKLYFPNFIRFLAVAIVGLGGGIYLLQI